MLFDFKCSNGHVFEQNVPSSVHSHECPTCSESAKRQISVSHLKIPYTGGYPGAALKWAKHHESGSKKYD